MNTTMAAGASERLDSQIADALFGQPGMSKMDVANRLRELRGDGAPVLANVGNPVSPSPAVLEDAPEIEQLRKLVSSILSTVSLGYQTGPYAYAGEDFGGYLREAASNCRTIMRGLSALAARQPVGQELRMLAYSTPLREAAFRALGFIDRSNEHSESAFHQLRRALLDDAAPPAQAVDLGQFRWAVELSRQHHSHGSALNEQVIAECDRLLALIDSKAVGNG
ncbi:hypothetical protein [Stenotrophomonas geniculata]|uniref:hypothetical protein n=1 Tax=Stenotrophomonas geniculata TaxID=86188 RepID=UPI002ACEF3F3|nr:hypothetical protein [Stenotrophomonas geniculata]